MSKLSDLNARVKEARAAARNVAYEAVDFGGMLASRGAHVVAHAAGDQCVAGEAESWPFTGKLSALRSMDAFLASHPEVVSMEITGGWDWAQNPRAYADGEYDPWVSDWAVNYFTKE